MKPVNTSVVLVAFVLAVGCAGASKGVTKAAAAELMCPARQLEIEELSKDRSGRTYLATGCGRAAEFRMGKKGAVERIGDVRDLPAPVAVAPVAPPPPAAAPAQGFTQEQFQAFVANHDASMAEMKRKQQAMFAEPPRTRPQTTLNAGPTTTTTASTTASVASQPVASNDLHASCCINGSYFDCPNSDALDRCAGKTARCLSGCMQSNDFDCAGRCTQSAPPDPSMCSRQSQQDVSCQR